MIRLCAAVIACASLQIRAQSLDKTTTTTPYSFFPAAPFYEGKYPRQDVLPECTCNCCTTQPEAANGNYWEQKVNGKALKGCGPVWYSQLSPREGDAPACPEVMLREGSTCIQPKEDPILGTALGMRTAGLEVDITRFCMHACTPQTTSNVRSGAACMPVTADVLEALGFYSATEAPATQVATTTPAPTAPPTTAVLTTDAAATPESTEVQAAAPASPAAAPVAAPAASSVAPVSAVSPPAAVPASPMVASAVAPAPAAGSFLSKVLKVKTLHAERA